MLDAGIIWRVVTEPGLVLVLAGTLVVAWPAGLRLARRRRRPRALGVGFVVVLGALLAATATVGSGRQPIHLQAGSLDAYVRQFGSWAVLLGGQSIFGRGGPSTSSASTIV